MILTLQQKLKTLLLSALVVCIYIPTVVAAQDALTLSVSPTLFNMSATPGQEWQSAVRVINANSYDLTVYVDVVDFAPEGESGQGVFISPNLEDTELGTFAEWIQLENREITIPAEQTIQIPFSIRVPDGAPPGGHSVALLIGTKPPQNETGTTKVETSQVITSLIFLRVAGDVNESGLIREFRTDNLIRETPEADFLLRFENNGNVHLQPQGEIKIFNMWGQERGIVPVNQRTLFGNVLPQSIRAYKFNWKGEWSAADIGRYTAVATLAYGEENRQFVSLETSFWIIPWKVLLGIILVLGTFIGLFTWAIKAYIRRMLQLAHVPTVIPTQTPIAKKVSVVAPLEAGILDLRARLKEDRTTTGLLHILIDYIKNYRFFFLMTFAVLLFITLVIWFIVTASEPERAYEFTIEETTSASTIPEE